MTYEQIKLLAEAYGVHFEFLFHDPHDPESAQIVRRILGIINNKDQRALLSWLNLGEQLADKASK